MTGEPPTSAFACEECNERWYYEKACCPNCGHREFSTDPLGVGELLSVTRVHVTPGDVREPNALGLAAFDDGVRLTAQLVDGYENPTIGDRVALSGGHTLRGEGNESVTGPRLGPISDDEES